MLPSKHTSIHCICSDPSQPHFSSLFVQEDFHHSVFVITCITFVTGFVWRHMANVITRSVTWKDCNYTSCQSGVIHISWCDCSLLWKMLSASLIVHETANLPVSSCFISQLMDSSIFHVTTVDWQAPFTLNITFFCESDQSFTHAFMQFYFAQLQLQKTQYLQLGQNRGQYYGGSLPNVNQIGNGNIDLPFQVSP